MKEQTEQSRSGRGNHLGKTDLEQRKGATRKELHLASWDVTAGIFISNLVMYAIILATAATLFRTGKHDVQSATDAAQALRPTAGDVTTQEGMGHNVGSVSCACPWMLVNELSGQAQDTAGGYLNSYHY